MTNFNGEPQKFCFLHLRTQQKPTIALSWYSWGYWRVLLTAATSHFLMTSKSNHLDLARIHFHAWYKLDYRGEKASKRFSIFFQEDQHISNFPDFPKNGMSNHYQIIPIMGKEAPTIEDRENGRRYGGSAMATTIHLKKKGTIFELKNHT